MASVATPLRLYYSDFDKNGQTETITAFSKNGTYYTLEGLDGLATQMVSLRKKFNTYQSFAGKSIDEILTSDQLNSASIKEVTTLASGYLRNNGSDFEFVPFPKALQVSPIMAFTLNDFDNDGKTEVLAGGNYFGVKPYHGRFDSFPGALIKNKDHIVLGNSIGLDFTQKSIRHLTTLMLNEKKYLLAVFNDAPVEIYKINSK